MEFDVEEAAAAVRGARAARTYGARSRVEAIVVGLFAVLAVLVAGVR